MSLNLKTLKKYISYILFCCGEVANLFGLFISIEMKNGIGSIIVTSLCFLSMTIIFLISQKEEKPNVFITPIVMIVGIVYFPMIWIYTKSPNTFILNTFLIPVSYAININKRKDFIIPIVNLIIYIFCILVKMAYMYAIIYTVIYLYILIVPSLFSILLTSYTKQLSEEKDTLENQAERDELTGLYNRYMLQKFIDTQKTYIPIMLDIDHFKNINDTYGHGEGDKVLKRLSELLLRFEREDFKMFRYGGEEFLILSKLSEESTIKRTIEFVVTVRQSLKVTSGESVTVSVGIGEESILDSNAIKIADINLYLSKNEGRNCICKNNKKIF